MSVIRKRMAAEYIEVREKSVEVAAFSEVRLVDFGGILGYFVRVS
jgi:hypothetical protein